MLAHWSPAQTAEDVPAPVQIAPSTTAESAPVPAPNPPATEVAPSGTAGQNAPAPTPPAKSAEATDNTARSVTPADLRKRSMPDDVAGPDVYYMFDDNQQLRRVLNIPYEEFIRVWDAMRDLRARAAPPYTLQSLKITGTAGSETADLRIELKVLLHTDREVKIPLGLDQAVLRSSKYEGDGQQFWNFEDNGDGYVSWLRGTPGKDQTIVMEIMVPLVKLGGETALRLGLPPAVSSSLTVDVDVPNAIGRVADDDTRKLATRNFATGKTQFSLVGVHGEFELAWRPADRPAPKIPTELTATGTLQVRIDGPSIQTDARLMIGSSGGEFEQIRVRLPPNAKLVPSTPAGYEVVPVEGQAQEDAAQQGLLFDVKLSQKTSDPVEIRLRSEQSRSGKTVTRGIDLAGFEVIGAARQWGYVAVEVVGDWQVQWVKQQNVRRIEKLPDAPVTSSPIASFEYFGQPFVLTAHISPRTTRIRVEPEYIVFVGPKQLTLDGRLKYNIRGASEFALVINVPGWEDVEIEPVDGVDDKNILLEGSQLTVPLQPPRIGPFELRLKGRRLIEENGAAIFSLPVPRATSQTTATVVVLPDDNIDLTPHAEGIAGLTPEHVLPRIELPPRQQEPLVYRVEPGETKFAAQVRVLPQSIDVDVSSVVHLDRDAWRVDQTFVYRVEYEPVDHVTLLLPQAHKPNVKPEVSFDGQLLDDAALVWEASTEPMLPADAEPADAMVKDAVSAAPSDKKRDRANKVTEQARLRIKLPAPARFGRFELLVAYPIARRGLSPNQPIAFDAPLFRPAQGELAEQTALILAPADLRITKIGEPWVAREIDSNSTPARGLQIVASEATGLLPLTVEAEEHVTPGATVIDLAWVQSWLTNTERQDRACYRLSTTEEHLDFRLPAGISSSEVQATVDGFPARVEVAPGGKLSIVLPHSRARRRHLELQYRFPERTSRFGRLALEAPQPIGGAWIQTTYWQVILPADELLLSAPDSFVEEYQWGWNGLLVYRPLHEQADLEAMVGAATGLPVPARSNRYVFRDVGAPPELTIHTIRLSWLIFATGLLLLGSGFALLYFPALRQPWLLAAVAICLLPFAVRFPTTGVLLAQAASVGVLLVFLAGLLKALLRVPVPEHKPEAEVIEPASLTEPRSSTRSYVAGPVSHDSSAATTIALHTSEAGE